LNVDTKTVKVVPFSDLRLLDIGHEIQLAGAVYAGKGKVFLMMCPDEPLEDQEIVAMEMTQNQWLEVIRQSDLLETEVLAKMPDGKLGKAVLRKSTRQIEQGVSWQVFRRDSQDNVRHPGNPFCCYCSNDSTPLTVDHLVCWEAGGPSIPENLLSCCRRCNKMRGNTPYEEWILRDQGYLRVSNNLSEARRQKNRDLVATLDKIQRRVHVVSR